MTDEIHWFCRNIAINYVFSQGVDRATFDRTFEFSVQLDVQRANELAEADHLEGTPSFVVGGQLLTSPAIAGSSYEGAIKQLEMLIPMARSRGTH